MSESEHDIVPLTYTKRHEKRHVPLYCNTVPVLHPLLSLRMKSTMGESDAGASMVQSPWSAILFLDISRYYEI